MKWKAPEKNITKKRVFFWFASKYNMFILGYLKQWANESEEIYSVFKKYLK